MKAIKENWKLVLIVASGIVAVIDHILFTGCHEMSQINHET